MCEVKICGLTNIDDARFAWESGADYLGFVLYQRSSRSVTEDVLGEILSALPGEVRAVGVFVNEKPEEVCRIAGAYGLWAVQLHGEEESGLWQSVPCYVWRAVRFVGGEPGPDPARWPAERYVVDTSVPGMYGGTGVTGDWAAAAELAGRSRIMLSGGLRAENVKVAVEKVMPYGVDVASGVEKAAGIKSHERVGRFISQARAGAAASVPAAGDDR